VPPCTLGLLQAKLKSEKWRTRVDLIVCLEDARKYIEATHLSDISLIGIANAAGLSKHHLARLFHLAYGTSPMSYAIKYKLKDGARLLAKTDQAVTFIAIEIGFSDGTAFGRAFKREFGVSPLQYRANAKKNPYSLGSK
jgi:AraC family transcriptional regulator